MDPTHQERAVGGENTAASTKPELRQHSTQTHQQAAYQAPERTLKVKAGGKSNVLLLGLHWVFHQW